MKKIDIVKIVVEKRVQDFENDDIFRSAYHDRIEELKWMLDLIEKLKGGECCGHCERD